MPRRSNGQVAERRWKGGTTYALRFYAGGKRRYVTLGTADEGWTRRKAEDELAATMAAVRAGNWKPPEAKPIAEPEPETTFHEFASEWFAAGEPGWEERTGKNYKWQLSNHLLPFFKDHRLREITVAEVDRYREAKQREGKLGGSTINRTITRLGQILEVAHERELIDRNPVRVNPRRRKAKVTKRRPVYLDSPDQIVAVLDAAGALDSDPKSKTAGRRPFIATLIFAGLRIGEACALKRHHVDLAAGRIEVPGTKTDAAARDVDLLPVLRDELAAYLAGRGEVGAYEPMFPTAAGRHRDINNARQKVVGPVVEEANELALARTNRPLPEGVTAHKLRHTFASLLLVHDPDPANAMAQLGHADPAFTIRVYTHLMSRSAPERERMRALIEGARAPERALTGTSGAAEENSPPNGTEPVGAGNRSAKR